MDYFERFEWAVPREFAEALEYCRFEAGDMLYADSVVYETDWGKAKGRERRCIQVRSPDRRPSRAGEGEGGRFDTNWKSRATIDLYRGGHSQASEPTVTTQGRIYTALWSGDIGVLDVEASEPPMPVRVRDVTKQLGSIDLRFKRPADSHRSFVMARDLANEISSAKFRAVHGVLGKHLVGNPQVLSPETVGFEQWQLIAPTVDVAVFCLGDIAPEQIEALVKKAVYVPAKNAKADRFRLNSHGVVLSWI